jgi:hypothetical protein
LDIVEGDFDLVRVSKDIDAGAELDGEFTRSDKHLVIPPPESGAYDSSARATSDFVRITSICTEEL